MGIRAHYFQRIHPPSNFGLDCLAGHGIWIGRKRDEQSSRRFRGVERQEMLRIAQQRNAAVGGALRLRLVGGQRKFFVQAGYIN